MLDEQPGILDERDRVGEEGIDLAALHHVVVRRQQALRRERLQRPGGAEVARDVEVGRRVDHVLLEIEESTSQHGIHHDGRARGRIPEADVPGRVAGQVEHLDRQPGSQADPFAGAQVHVDRRVRTHRISQPGEDLRLVREAVLRVPAVPLSQDRLAALDPAHVELVGEKQRPGRRLPDRRVPAEMVDIGVRVEHEVRLKTVEERKDHLRGRLLDSGVEEQRALVAQQVLRERPWSEHALDAMDAGSYLHQWQSSPSSKSSGIRSIASSSSAAAT